MTRHLRWQAVKTDISCESKYRQDVGEPSRVDRTHASVERLNQEAGLPVSDYANKTDSVKLPFN